MAINKFVLVALSCCLSATGFTGSMGWESNFGNTGFVATLSAGPAWARPGERHTLTLHPTLQQTFLPVRQSRALRLVSTADGTRTLATGELFLGMRNAVNSVVEGQLGLSLGASTSVRLKGSALQDTNPLHHNFNYSYNIRNSRVAAKAKFLYDTDFYDLFPYLSGSAGLSFNRASGFSFSSKIPGEIPPPAFHDNSQHELSYSIGVGLETTLDAGWRLGLGYEFLDWGRSALARAIGQTVGQGPYVSHLRSHELLVSVTYLA
ncbi:MAG: porin family protein [Tatlockia sp.]|nr:porin family protein [Tatlockia sp.]